jgi:hypothetical protein
LRVCESRRETVPTSQVALTTQNFTRVPTRSGRSDGVAGMCWKQQKHDTPPRSFCLPQGERKFEANSQDERQLQERNADGREMRTANWR